MFSFKRLFRRKAAGDPKPQSVSNALVSVPVPASVSAPSPTSTAPARKSLAKRICKTLKKAWARVVEFLLEDVPVSYPGMVNDPLAHQARLQYHAQLAAKKAKAAASKASSAIIVQVAQAAMPVPQPIIAANRKNKSSSDSQSMERVLPYKAANTDIGRLFLERLFVELPPQKPEYEDLNLDLLFHDVENAITQPVESIYQECHLDLLFEEPVEECNWMCIPRSLSVENMSSTLHQYALKSFTSYDLCSVHRCASYDSFSLLS